MEERLMTIHCKSIKSNWISRDPQSPAASLFSRQRPGSPWGYTGTAQSRIPLLQQNQWYSLLLPQPPSSDPVLPTKRQPHLHLCALTPLPVRRWWDSCWESRESSGEKVVKYMIKEKFLSWPLVQGGSSCVLTVVGSSADCLGLRQPQDPQSTLTIHKELSISWQDLHLKYAFKMSILGKPPTWMSRTKIN